MIDESLIDEGVHTWFDAGIHAWIEESVNNEIDESLHSCAPPPIYRTPMSIHPQALTTRILLTLLSDRVARRLTEFGPYDIMSKGAVVRRQVGRRYGRGRLQIAAEYDTLGEGSVQYTRARAAHLYTREPRGGRSMAPSFDSRSFHCLN